MAGDLGIEQPAPSADESSATGLNFYRPQRRVVPLLFVAPVFYEFWWYWQLFAFTRREGFPRARRFWWILVPIYGWVVIFRQFDDLAGVAPRRSFSSGTAIWLVIFSWIAGNVSFRVNAAYTSFGAFVVSNALIALAGSLVQPAANAYLDEKYPEARPSGMTWGEVTAAVLGILLFGLELLLTFAWS
ncbi:MAG TPA: hypothetical protein VI142_06285 [Gaiellaceae bacterium]